MGYIGKALRQQGTDLGALTVLAKATVAPRDMPAMRLPELLRRRTDARHVWHGGLLSPVTSIGNSNKGIEHPTVGGSELVQGEVLAFLTRDPISLS